MPYNKKCLFKWFPSLRVLPLLALLLAFAPNAYAARFCQSSLYPTPASNCAASYPNESYPVRYNGCGNASCSSLSYSCLISTGAAIKTFTCAGSCDAGLELFNPTGECLPPCAAGSSRDSVTGQCVSDEPPDDCSASLWGDLSGNSYDGSCGCPSPSVNNGFGSCVTCEEGQVINSSGECSSSCPGNLQLVNGSCGCLAGQTLGTFNGVQSCQPSSPAEPLTQGGGTLVTESGTTINVVNNSDGTTTTTTTTTNNTTIVGGSAGTGTGGTSGSGIGGTGTISNGTSTMSITTDASGQVISATGSSQNEEAQDSLTLPAVLEARELSIGEGISQAFANAPIVSALNAALGAFPTSGACSVISMSLKIPYNPPVNVNMSKQCDLFADISSYLTMFAMVVYGLLSYKVFIRSASGV